MAIACLRLVTFLPERPLRSVPRLRSCIARLTLLCAFFPYRAMLRLLVSTHCFETLHGERLFHAGRLRRFMSLRMRANRGTQSGRQQQGGQKKDRSQHGNQQGGQNRQQGHDQERDQPGRNRNDQETDQERGKGTER
jgi:hypothetical protein